jgi:hypothetical protein
MVDVPPVLRRLAVRLGREAVRSAVQRLRPTTTSGASGRAGTRRRDARRGTPATRDVRAEVTYAPVRDGDADPGEVVWTWVPYEDDPSRGKDRPVLVVGRIGDDVAALALTSREHHDRHHHPLGVWDGADGRPSWVKLDRVIRLDPQGIRREGAVLDRARFDTTVAAWQAY